MKSSSKNKKAHQRRLINNTATVTALVLLPVIGLLALTRKTLAWKTSTKWIVALLTILYIPFHAGIFAYLFWFGGINYIGPHDAQALQYLQNRYHEQFIIVRSASSDQLGGSSDYDKWAAPRNDTSLEFRVSKCLARCQSYESTEFHDSYPQKKWTKQLTKRFKSELTLNDRQGIAAYVNSTTAAQIVDAHGGSIPEFYSMSETEKHQMGISVHFSEKDGEYTPNTRETHANKILQIASLIRDAEAGAGSITYDIRARTPTGVITNSKDQFHFTTDKALTLSSLDEIFPLFVVHTYGRGATVDGYNGRQVQLNASRGQSSAGASRPNTESIKKAKRELAIADVIRSDISPGYLVAPYVVVAIESSSDAQLPDYDNVVAKTLTTNVEVFNYPNDTIPISNETHRSHVIALIDTLKVMFDKTNLTYKSDSFSCEARQITAATSSTEIVRLCLDK